MEKLEITRNAQTDQFSVVLRRLRKPLTLQSRTRDPKRVRLPIGIVDVRFGSLADIEVVIDDVGFTPNNGQSRSPDLCGTPFLIGT